MRCEDWPACGHVDGLPCDWTPPDYHANPLLLHEPGSPEWYDTLADLCSCGRAIDEWCDECELCIECHPDGVWCDEVVTTL